MAKKLPSSMVVGLAFFSMLFGSGNLIFPLSLGATYQSHFLIASLGFIITAVILPCIGIIAMLPAQGHYEKLFSDFLPKQLSRYFILLMLVFWIPLGSGPRCVVLAHASLSSYVMAIPLWIFAILFLGATYLCVVSRQKIIDILGKFLTPLLLLSILAIVLASVFHGKIATSSFAKSTVFINSLLDGYYTQDLIASVFFSSALVNMLKACGSSKEECIKKTWQGGLIAVFLLAILYTALMASSAIHADILQHLSGEKLISTLAHASLGGALGGVSSLAVFLACFTTEIALVLVFADFLEQNFMFKKGLVITLLLVGLTSQLEFKGIMAIISPAMQMIYPILFFLVVRFIWHKRRFIYG